MALSKDKMLEELGVKGDLPIEAIEFLYKNRSKWKKENSTKKESVKVNKEIDKTTDKYKMALKLVNAILKNLNKDPIDDLTEFKDIDREDIIKDDNKKVLKDMEGELFNVFDKKKCGYYRKTDNLVLNTLRGICKEVGVEFVIEKKNRYDKFNDKIYKRTGYFYSIK